VLPQEAQKIRFSRRTKVFSLYLTKSYNIPNKPIVHTNKRNSTSVRTAATVSKIRMKQSATKIPSIFAAIRGLAQHYPAMQQLFTHHQLVRMKQILAVIAGKISHALESLHQPRAGTKSL
jgi:hypothetical protein